ncbi:hypothetical protein AGOR_G00252720 [Albula goreensis]|uniref:Uncharacterized protein n=1 Tax=Albula goreensis TaxID=1534307 RepID=A0A8T3CGT4_9TELE|nr:hypothetical protein AGOR_G00252720 [Albula goreensis]
MYKDDPPASLRSMDFLTAAPCSPKRHVMFLKTHKTGGSTVQNMMLRYTDKANLTLAVPQEHRVSFVETKMFSPKYIRNYKAGKTYDVITHHLRFNPKEVRWWFYCFGRPSSYIHISHSNFIAAFINSQQRIIQQ